MGIAETRERLRTLETRRAELLARLDLSLELQRHFPDAFRAGSASVRVIGNAYRPDELRFIVRRGDGSEIERRALDVPPILWVRTLDTLRATVRDGTRAARLYDRLRQNLEFA